MWQQYNPNQRGQRVGDCTVRAIAGALGMDWPTVYWMICIEGAIQQDMPDADAVWGAYLERMGYRRRLVEAECSKCYTVRDFAREHPLGTYILCPKGHVICVKDGNWWDTWDSGDERPIYYWQKEDTANV